MARKTKRRRGRREALVHRHLENVSRKLFERHPDVVRDFIGGNAGIYALYRKKKLYYVGLAKALRNRLKAHVKNRHSNSWDRFSIYLTIKDQHIREIEALILRVANPPGAKQRGKLFQSENMRQQIQRAIHAKQQNEVFIAIRSRNKSHRAFRRSRYRKRRSELVCCLMAPRSEAHSKTRPFERA